MNDWYTIKKYSDDIYIIQEHHHWECTNMYYIIGDTYNLLIDSGTGMYPLKDLLLQIDAKPIQVISTHIHWDHIGNHQEFDHLYVHPGDANWLKEGLPLNLEFIKSQLVKDVDSKYLNENPTLDNFSLFKTKNFSLLYEGQKFDLGKRVLKVIHTPGHSPGHIMLYDEKNKLLLTGDVCYKGTIYCHYESTNPIDLLNSYKKVKDLEIIELLPSHYETPISKDILLEGYTLLEEQASNSTLTHGYGCLKGENISIMI